MRILSINALAYDDVWYWNEWHEVGNMSVKTFDPLYNLEQREDNVFVNWLIEHGFLVDIPNSYITDDDGYNIVICDAETMEPLYAIEYGAEE